jgi:hypothetical protein
MVMIGEWPIDNGVLAYTITGTKEELTNILKALKEDDFIFANEPIFNHVHRGQWHLYLKIKIPIGVTPNANNSNTYANDKNTS